MSEYKKLDEWFPDGKPDGRMFKVEKSSFIIEPKFRDWYGTWYCLSQDLVCCSYTHAAKFKEYVPPKQTKKVKMYKPVRRGYGIHYRTRSDDEWHTDKDNFTETRTILGWLEMEIEVE